MDETTFLALVKEHQKIIHKICYIYRDSREDREDLFQEITFQLWKAWPSFKGDAKVTTWMYRIALNTAIAIFRKNKLIIEFTSELPDRADNITEDDFELKQKQLLAALKLLNDTEKAIITLYLEGLSYSRIAEIIGINENYVGVKINRIKIKIQKITK